VEFHPLAAEVMVTVGADKNVKIWDLEAGEVRLQLPTEHKAMLTSLEWSGDLALLATFAKDKKMRLFDPRANILAARVDAHDSTKGGRLVWLNRTGKILTTGFTRSSEREIRLWDSRSIDAPLHTLKFEPGSAPIIPYAEEDTNVVFLNGKGEGLIRMYEVVDSQPYLAELVDYKSSKPSAGLAMLPKKMCDVMDCEIAKFLKLTTNAVIPLSFTVPRQSKHFFQEDLYPPTWDGKPTMTAEEWLSGAATPPNKVSLDSGQK